MNNPSIIHRLIAVIHRFGTMPPDQNLPKRCQFRVLPVLMSAFQPSDCRPYSSDNRQMKAHDRPILFLIRKLIVNPIAVIVDPNPAIKNCMIRFFFLSSGLCDIQMSRPSVSPLHFGCTVPWIARSSRAMTVGGGVFSLSSSGTSTSSAQA